MLQTAPKGLNERNAGRPEAERAFRGRFAPTVVAVEIERLILKPAALAERLGIPSAQTMRIAGDQQLPIGQVRLVPLNEDDRAAAVELLAGLLDLHAPTHAGAPTTLTEGENE